MLRHDNQLAAKILKRVAQLRRLGARGIVRTAYVATLGRAAYSLTDPGRSIGRRLHRRKVLGRPLPPRLERLKHRAASEIEPKAAPLLREIDAGADARIAPERRAGTELVIGQFGDDGELLSRFGPICGLECVSIDNFAPPAGGGRAELVDLDGRLGVRHVFGSDGARFVQTLETMFDLAAAACAVPRVVAVDWSSKAITSAFVRGAPLSKREPTRASREQLLDLVEGAIVSIHRAGYALDRIDQDAILFSATDNRPTVADVRHAIPLRGLSRDMSVYLRDLDRRKVNRLFGTRLLSAGLLRRLHSPMTGLGQHAEKRSVYAPIIIRSDIRWGNFWNTDVGTGRWNFILNEHLPIPVGGCVLDLGSDNGFNPLQMLRLGAASAVGIEINANAIRQGQFLKAAYEWLDNRSYEFRCIHGSFADLPAYGLSQFDIVTALCSLYYLSDRQMRDLVRYIRTITDVLVLQCNTDRLIDREDEETYRKASVAFAIELLDEAGFTDRQIIAPVAYSRPLIIGRAS